MTTITLRRSRLIDAANTIGGVLRRARVTVGRLEVSPILDIARRRTGLEDFGDDAFLEPLEILLDSYRNEAQLSFIGQIVAQQSTIALLADRLRLVEDRKRNPEIAREHIDRPVFIVGLPRTGTTLLHTLLSQDPANRVPLTWELMHPSPPPARSTYETDARIARAQRQTKWLERLAPRFRAIHPVHARQPQECVSILSYSLLSSQFQTMFWIPTFEAWLEDQDLSTGYRWHRQILQHLQCRCPADRWVLKAPMHLFALDNLIAEYPDARIIQTHRDPLMVLGSVASLSEALQSAFSDSTDPLAIGTEVADRWLEGANRSVRFRAGLGKPASNILDVYFQDLQTDPMAVIRGLYSHFDMELSSQAETRMNSFLASNPKHARGRHVYDLADFGINPHEQHNRFATYREYFGVKPELALTPAVCAP